MDIVKKLFDTTDLFAVLNITAADASDPKILKKAYMSAALKFHPDKGPAEEREVRTQKFQVVKQIYELFQDEDLRKSYVETGEWPGKEEFLDDLGLGVRLDEQMILDFKKNYIGSEEEQEDVKSLYEKGKGDLLYVLDNLFFANILDDEERVKAIIGELISSGAMVKIGTGTVNQKARANKIKKATKEAKEAAALRKEMGMGDGIEGLKLALAKNASSRSGFITELEKKYAQPKKKAKEKTNGAASASTTKANGQKRKRPVKAASESEEDSVEEKPAPSKKAPKGRSRGRKSKQAKLTTQDDSE